MAIRFVFLTSFFAVIYGVLGFGLYRLQVEKSPYYFEKAQAQNEMNRQLGLRRGQIAFIDRSGRSIPEALNKDFPVVFANPTEVKNHSESARKLAPIIGWSEEELVETLNSPNIRFKLLVNKATPEVIKSVSELNLPGIYSDNKQYRYYPYGREASHVIGFAGLNERYSEPVGLYGAEKRWNETLAAGDNIQLTLDKIIQDEAEQHLSELLEKYGAVGGTIIVQEPKTGKVLAMASKPDFDPNDYSRSPITNFINPATQFVYEPGSVMKPITMAAGIDLGKFTPETTFTDTGKVVLNGKTINNANEKIYGKITMTGVIENSVNTGSVFAESLIGHENFYNYLKKFGFGDRTDIDLPDEVAGSLKNLEKKNKKAIDFATAAFGQGESVTPIQLVTAFSALANGGLLMRPYVEEKAGPYVTRRAVSGLTAEKVVKMMEAAVVKNKIAAIPGYRVAGKTGTAQVPDSQNGGYTDDMVHTFIGFAPVSDPKFVVLVKIDRPAVGELAGLTVVPAFRELAQFILNYYSIPPDQVGNQP